MKIKILAVLFLSALAAQAQSDPIRVGNYLGSGIPWQQPAKAAPRDDDPPAIYQKFDGKIYNINATSRVQAIRGKVYSLQDGGIVLVVRTSTEQGFKHLFLINYPDSGMSVAKDKMISAQAMWIGRTNVIYDGKPETFEMWDCGTSLTPEEERKIREEVATAKKKLIDDRLDSIRLKKFITNSNEVVRLKAAAADGSAAAQFSLALHYLNGQGCETNRVQAIHWLKLASDGGDSGAANKLAELSAQTK